MVDLFGGGGLGGGGGVGCPVLSVAVGSVCGVGLAGWVGPRVTRRG